MSTTTIHKSVFLQADRETVWAFLTQKDKLGQWFHPATNDLQSGQPYELVEHKDDGSVDKMCWGEVISMDAPASMVWSLTVGPLQGAMTTVSWTLEEAAGGTRVTLVHEGVEAAAGAAALGLLQALDAGWDEHFAKLRTQVAAMV